MLCNGCYKLLGCVYLKILLVIITMGHLRAVDNCAGLIDINGFWSKPKRYNYYKN